MKRILLLLLILSLAINSKSQSGFDPTQPMQNINISGARYKKLAARFLLQAPNVRPDNYGTDESGAIIFNAGTGLFEGWDGTQYIPLGGITDNIYTADGIVDAGDEDAVRYVAVKSGNALQIFAKYDETDPGIAPGSFFIMEQGGTSLYYYKRDVGVYEETNGFQTANDGLMIYSNYTDLATSESSNIEFSFSAGNAIFKDLKTVPVGIQYFDDYSSTFTDRSLVDKGYVDGFASGLTLDNIMSNGSNLSSSYTIGIADNTLFFTSNHITENSGFTIVSTGNVNISGQLLGIADGYAPGYFINRNDDDVSAVSTALIAAHSLIDETATGGIGSAIDFQVQNNGEELTRAGRLIFKYVDVTANAEGSNFELWGKNVGTEYMWMGFTGLGQLQIPRYSAGTFTGTVYKNLAINSAGYVIVTDPSTGSGLQDVITADPDLTGDNFVTIPDGNILSFSSSGTDASDLSITSNAITAYTLHSGSTFAIGTANTSAYMQYTGASATNVFYALSNSVIGQFQNGSIKSYFSASANGSSLGVQDNSATYYNSLIVGTGSTGNQVSFLTESGIASWSLPRNLPDHSGMIWVADADGVMSWADPSGGGDFATVLASSSSSSVSSSDLATVMSNETGSGLLVFATSPTLTTPNLGTPSAITLTHGTGLPISTGISGLGTGVATYLATPSSSNLASMIPDETGSGSLVFANSPTFVTQITSPLIIGGTGTTSTLTFQTTTGVGTTGADFVWKGGNNGGSTLMTLTNAGGLTTSGTASFGTLVSTGALIRAPSAGYIDWGSSNTRIYAPSNGVLQITSNSGTAQTGTLSTGGIITNYVAKTGTYTLTGSDYVVDCTSGTFTVTLPTAVGRAGQDYVIKNSGAGTITIATTSSQTIDGASTVSLSVQYSGKRLQSNGSNWIVIGSF